jgi:hypothetical protein
MLIELIGSEKQVAWALKIREEKLEFVRQALSKVFTDKLNLATETLSNIDSAKFWIENKQTTGLALGIYGITLSGAKLGLPEDKNFIYPWIYRTETKKKNGAGEWVVDKVDEKPTQDM